GLRRETDISPPRPIYRLKGVDRRAIFKTLTVVIWESNSGRIQSLPEVQGKGKEKLIDEQVAHTLLDLNTPKKKSASDQYILQKRTPKTAKPTGQSSQPGDERITMTNSETESDEIVTPVNKEKDASNRVLTEINAGVQDEGHAGSNPDKQDEGQARSNPGNSAKFQPQPSHVAHAGPNLEPMDLAVSDAYTQQNPEQIDEEFTITTYPNVQENLKLQTEDQEEEPEKTNAESEVQSMVTVPIHQDTSSIPLMTTPVIDLTTTTYPTLLQCMGELEQHMENLIQDILASEEMLNNHGSRLYNLENLNIPQKVSKAVDEIVTDAVDWALQASLRARFRDLPEVDMKEILL
nr:hypothetical protein [Tanacetum cinerariifolium]